MSVRSALLGRLKTTLLIWIAVFPSALLVVTLLGGFMQDWPLAQQILGSTLIAVPIVANITQPAVQAAVAALERRMARRRAHRQRT